MPNRTINPRSETRTFTRDGVLVMTNVFDLGGLVPEPPEPAVRNTAIELRPGDQVYMQRLNNDAGWVLDEGHTEWVGTVQAVRFEDFPPRLTTYQQRRMPRRLMITVDRGVRSLDIVFAVAETPVKLAN